MARTVVPVVKRVIDGGVIETAGIAADPTNGHVVTPREPRELTLRVQNTAVTDKTVTIKAGTGTQDVGSPGSDKVITVTASSVAQIGPFTGAYFETAAGALNIDLQAGFTGTLWAFENPRGV